MRRNRSSIAAVDGWSINLFKKKLQSRLPTYNLYLDLLVEIIVQQLSFHFFHLNNIVGFAFGWRNIH